MGRELSEAVQVPQVFEPGARVAWRRTNVPPRILSHIDNGSWIGVPVDGAEKCLCSARDASLGLEVLAPAPRVGQRWENSHHKMRISSWDASTPIATARRLLEHGYSYAGLADAAPATLRASEPTPAVAAQPDPAPWTLTAARRLITKTIADAAPRCPTAFTSALCALAEHGVPEAWFVLAASSALTALEESLPEYGAPADWEERRALSRAGEVFLVAADLKELPEIASAVFEIYVTRRRISA
jgi:hypothetical protein